MKLITFILYIILPIALSINKECKDTNTNQNAEILYNGKTEIIPSTDFQVQQLNTNNHSTKVANIKGGESINLQYVKSFLSPEEVEKLLSICDKRNGWQTSPQNLDGTVKVHRKKRTSSSCPIIWPLLYLPKMEAYKASGKLSKDIEEEIYLSWMITQRIASFLNVNESHVEPLQVLRYTNGQFYRQHHDHGGYYGIDTSEQRPKTFLLFLSSMNKNDGGQTRFNNLDIDVVPRLGDGIVWSNVDEDGNVLLDAVHEAVPIEGSNSADVIKYAMNVWITDKPVMENIGSIIYRT